MSESDPTQNPAIEKLIEKLKAGIPVHWEKGRNFRVIHVDGAHGGISPQATHITMTLYSERTPIPKEQRIFMLDDGTQETKTPKGMGNLDGVFREAEVCAVMDFEVAKNLHAWLGGRLKDIERTKQTLKEMGDELGQQ